MKMFFISQQKEVIVMDADGSQACDDSIPLLFSGARFVQFDFGRIPARDHFLGCMIRK